MKKILSVIILLSLLSSYSFPAFAAQESIDVDLTVTADEEVESSGGGGGTGQYSSPVIYDIGVTPSLNGAVITWKTTMSAQSELSFGETNGLEKGTTGNSTFATLHSASLAGLKAGTIHYFEISAVNEYGVTFTTNIQSFVTLFIPEGVANPQSFTATPLTESILLEWQNPTDSNFSEVRLVRNDNFFPSDPNDGSVIYEGNLEMFEDRDVVIGKRYYYGIFSKGESGEFSSGLVASARIPIPGEPVSPPDDVIDGLPQAPDVHPQIENLTFLDFDFIQDGKKIPTLGGETIGIDGTKNLTVSLDFEKVPEVLKSIVITLSHPSDSTKVFSFLLRVNEEKTAYTATIAPLGESGEYGVRIAIVDYKNQGLKKIVGNLYASVQVAYESSRGLTAYIITILSRWWMLILILIIVALILAKSFLEQKKKKTVIDSEVQASN